MQGGKTKDIIASEEDLIMKIFVLTVCPSGLLCPESHQFHLIPAVLQNLSSNTIQIIHNHLELHVQKLFLEHQLEG